MLTPSPLRYPGGKAKLFSYIKNIIEFNNLDNITYVEPFAGGCGLALALLQKGLANEIFINDLDYAIYSFWQAILTETERFCEAISNIQITIEEWDRQKEIYLHQDAHNIFDVGFSAFFLNRTNRSGILDGGIIGGREQNSQYTIDCRFNRKTLIDKIKRIAQYAGRIHVYNYDAIDMIDNVIVDLDVNNTLVYFDPPYVNKGPQLYKNSFIFDDHVNLYNSIAEKVEQPWLVTYDHTDEIAILYKQYQQDVIDINYSAGVNKKGRELAIFSDRLFVPQMELVQ